MKKPTVTIGIPAYNEEANIKHLLNALMLQKTSNYRLEKIIVVSDGSRDRTEYKVRSIKDPRVLLLINKARIGLNATQNRILENTSSDILVLLDADILPENSNCISKLIAPIILDSRVGLTSGKLYAIRTLRKPIGRIVASGHEMKRHVFERLSNPHNVYLCSGRIRAFSRSFYMNLRWPDDVPEDAYSYFSAIKKKFYFRYVGDAICYFHPSTTLNDHIIQYRRFVEGKAAIAKYFSKSLLAGAYAIPLSLVAKAAIEFAFKRPVSIPFYFLMMFYISSFANMRKREHSRYEIALSSKSVASALKVMNKTI